MSEGDDPRTQDTVRLDLMVDQVADLARAVQALVDKVPASANTQTVIHRQAGMGVLGVICATICFMCVLFLILGAIIFVPDIHDLRAWNDITRKDIARLQAQQQLEKGK